MRIRSRSSLCLGLAAAGLLLAARPAAAAVRPHGLFTDNAVLQRGMKVPVWGTAADGEKVTVSIAGKKATTTAKGGNWKVEIGPLKAGGPYTLTIAGDNTVELKNVLVGEVWIASGQSNMEWPLQVTATGPQDIQAASDPQLRLYTIAKATSDTPVHEINAAWQECNPQTVPRFSAVAYYFGRELRRALNVPVGLIHTSWGGTVAEAWTSHPTLETDPALRVLIENYQQAVERYPVTQRAYQQAMEQYRQAAEEARAAGRTVPPAPPAPPNPAQGPNRPSVLYNAMIAPLQPYAIKGAIWYQGESNAGRAYQYQTLFPAMIRDWRETWGQGDFPFLFVQLAPFMQIQQEPMESAWAELREAQRLTALKVPHTGMAVITDVGEERDIHPRKKEPVGRRLALAALEQVYGKDVNGTGPRLRSAKFEKGRAVLRFEGTGGGLRVDGRKATGFTIAGADHRWFNADATVEGDKVIVSSPQVPDPVAVRYGWSNFPVLNLFSNDGLPATPFRTDDFPFTTQPK
jgi:sialate O-acetylesterase